MPVLRIPSIDERIGPVESLFTMPLWVTIAIGAVTASVSTERAVRMRYRWWLDAAGNWHELGQVTERLASGFSARSPPL